MSWKQHLAPLLADAKPLRYWSRHHCLQHLTVPKSRVLSRAEVEKRVAKVRQLYADADRYFEKFPQVPADSPQALHWEKMISDFAQTCAEQRLGGKKGA